MDPQLESQLNLNRRHFFSKTAKGIGGAALASLLGRDLGIAAETSGLHFPAKAKRVIYLFQSGAPSQQDLFDPKPLIQKHAGQELSKYVEMNERVTGMHQKPKKLPHCRQPLRIQTTWQKRCHCEQPPSSHCQHFRQTLLYQIHANGSHQP